MRHILKFDISNDDNLNFSTIKSTRPASASSLRKRKGRVRVGFLFNHHAVHQVFHAAPYAFEFSRRYPEFEAIVAASSDSEINAARAIGDLYPGHRCSFHRLYPAWWYSPFDPVVSKFVFERKRRILRDNLDFFRDLDAVVAPELHCRRLRTEPELADLLLIHAEHGAGDRETKSDRHMRLFDGILLPGRKYADRLSQTGHVRAGHYAVVGYPKFEVVRSLGRASRRMFENDNPIVVYNPHFDQKVSSWRKMGHDVLEFFAANSNYNLIFAPHVVLFARRWRHRAWMPSRYRNSPNILIDVDGASLADMTYTRAADIYLGDVSSQVYEFLLNPRPCVFLNAHRVAWQNDPHYAHWHLGQVVDDLPEALDSALDASRASQDHYRQKQQAAFAYAFHEDAESTAAQRGADAIARFLAQAWSISPGNTFLVD